MSAPRKPLSQRAFRGLVGLPPDDSDQPAPIVLEPVTTVTRPCSACGESVEVPLVGKRDPRPKINLPLCDRPKCISAREARKARVAEGTKEAIADARRNVDGGGRIEPDVIEIETSEGTVIRESKPRANTSGELESDFDVNNMEAEDVDKLKEKDKLKHRRKAESLKNKKPKKAVIKAPPAPAKQPRYLKTVSFPVVPSTDPEAPFGRDADNRPLVPMRTDQEIAAELRDKSYLKRGKCRHRNDPNDCLLCGTKRMVLKPDEWFPLVPPETKEEEMERLEQNARRTFGLPEPKTWKPREHKPRTKIESFREVLLLDRGYIADLFDKVIGEEEKVTDVAVKTDRKKLERRADNLQKLIKRSNERIEGWSVRVLKLRRPDNIPDKPAREEFKRAERKRLARFEAKLKEVRERLRNWETDPRNQQTRQQLVKVPVTFGEKYDIQHQEVKTEFKYVPGKLRTPSDGAEYWTEDPMYFDTPVGDEYEIYGYRALLKLGEEAELYLTNGMNLDGWREWENKVIEQAIYSGLIKPNMALLGLHPRLAKYNPSPDSIEADTTEDALALKTGGANWNASIYSGGVRVGKHGNSQRALEDFGKTMEFGNKDKGQRGGSPSFLGDLDSGDVGERSEDE
jgi:hypothetical protein